MIPHFQPHARELFRGVRRWLREHQAWRVTYRIGDLPSPAQLFGDGLLAVASNATRDAVCAAGKPWVEIGDSTPDPRRPAVATDDDGVGGVAARHFLERRFRHFAYVSYTLDEDSWDRRRHQGFSRGLLQAGLTCTTFQLSQYDLERPAVDQEQVVARLGAWIAAQPKPLAVYGGNDWCAWEVMRACSDRGIRIPDDVAVLGTDDSDPCDMGDPPLSSIPLPNEQVGYAAAGLLQRLMDGERDVPLVTLIPPLPVIVRRSSDAVAIDDPEIAEALRIIEARFAEPLGTEDLARELTISRRALERRFREQLGRTLHDEITRARIAHAKQLLSNTEIPISSVAEQCGFSGSPSLGRAFARSEGLGPGAYRRHARAR